MEKKCFKCHKVKYLECFYKHNETLDGHLGKCKDCARNDAAIKNGIHKRVCVICLAKFRTTASEISRGGGNCCSRKCWFVRFNNIVKREEQSPKWKGNNVGKAALHCWVNKKLGRPDKCEHCLKTDCKNLDWANKSQKYKRDVNDWIRLCRKCHTKYDYKTRISKWRKSVKKLGWNVKLTKTF